MKTQIRNNWERFTEVRRQAKKTGQPLEHLTAGEYLSRFSKNRSINADYFARILLWVRTVGRTGGLI